MEDTLSDASISPTSSPPPVMEVQDVETHSSENHRSSSHSQQTKKPTNQSIVWEHLKKVEPIDKDNLKAKCNHCSKLIGCHYRRNGTSPMMTHLTHGCPTSPLLKSKLSKGQTLLQMSLKKSVEGTTSNQLGFKKYDPEILRNGLAEYFIASELPFRHVESHSFRKWMNLVEPRFNVPSRTTLQKDCMKVCEREKLTLKSVLRGKRICITTDTWTSIQNFNYMCVTAHFIDRDWILHKKIIKFCLISNHSGEEIGKMLESTLREWGIGGVYTITVDNASANKLGIEYLKKRLKDKNYTVLGAEFLHMRCAAHILNLVVQEGLDELDDCIDNIRNAIKYVRSSPSRMAKFKDCIQRENITCTKTVCLDVKTRWNSTYLMLCTAEKYEKAFELLGEEDHQFVVPSMIDWENARAFVKFLKTSF
ncbi:zinc finger BED domain-containing protein RICESLEEPER 2-like [Corylus avellana]|uniref:zinc finger BED domain-containing protein RICESLEEPER 2-like n=1 Tax=Corylus avellana TaxID=13451 RepID=UPI00286D45CC|nr:zinc finger BED domain-containing protein RICESLEEPER 2-like [Corylus avellana]